MKQFLLLICVMIYSFPATCQTHPASITPVKTYNVNDTIITKDENGDENVVIKNGLGVILSQGKMHNGKKEDVWRSYTIRGVLTALDEFKNGKRNGASVTMAANNQIQVDATYKNDSLDGQKVIYQNSRIKSVEIFTNGILNGPRTSYYEDGKVQEEAVYKNGQREGTSRWYLQSGKPSVEYNYSNGTLEGKGKEFDDNGNIKRTGFYKNNVEEGEWQEYQDSVLTKKIIYKKGEVVKEVTVNKK